MGLTIKDRDLEIDRLGEMSGMATLRLGKECVSKTSRYAGTRTPFAADLQYTTSFFC